MAGFFGLFDYSKVGPGVSKSEPQKKGFVVFFEIYFRKFWKLITANLLYVLVKLPLITGGLADAGLTYITRNFARQKHAFIAGDFFDTIKKNWKQALLIGIINLVIMVIIVADLWLMLPAFFFVKGDTETQAQGPGIFNYIVLAVIFMFTVVFSFMKYYIPMLTITFKLSLKQIYKNSFIFAFVGLKRNLLISLVLLLCYAAAVALFFAGYIGWTILIFLYVLLFPAFRSYLIQYNIFPLIKKHMIDPYYKEHPGEDKEAKRALNILEEEEDQNREEAVFQDTGRTEPMETEEPETKGRKQKANIPKQYNEQDLRRGRRLTRDNRPDDDDDTI